MKKVIFGLCLLLTISLGQASYAQKKIVFLGDSLTAGYGLSDEEAYPALIEGKIEEKGLDWSVINAGVSGDTTRGGLKRLNWILKSSPTVVFVALGANDGLRGFKVNHSKENIEKIVVQLKKRGILPILAGMKLPMNYGNKYRTDFEKIFSSIAKKYHISHFPFLLDGVAMVPELNLSDGIHPNEKGHIKIADQVFKFLLPILKKVDGQK